ncbi:50S ribosomal protein L31 [Candidatus Uhrbacteria bacterium]|nr:50S ribosomal protein L31 [Candidatus Uhrbacteria bacterium]
MKLEIHPEYFENAAITCACGAKYEIGSTMNEIQVELCAACHPFYTGTQKIVDSAHRVERFKEKMVKKSAVVAPTGKKVKREKRAAIKAAETAEKEAKAAPKVQAVVEEPKLAEEPKQEAQA